MIIAVSGATGMIGSALIKYALGQGDKVIAIIRPDSARKDSIVFNDNVTVIQCDLKDFANFNTDKKADVFFHFAWDKTSHTNRDDIESQLVNVQYTLDAVTLASKMGCSAFVGAGSQAEYGVLKEDKQLTPSTPCNPESAYGMAKYMAGKFSFLRASQMNVRHVWARILSVYGKNDSKSTLISYLADCFLNGNAPELTKCEQIWDYINADDCGRAIYLLGKSGKNGKAYPIGSGERRTLKEYVKVMRDVLNPECEIEFGKKPYYPHQPMFLSADISELEKDVGFKPNVKFEDGIKAVYGKR